MEGLKANAFRSTCQALREEVIRITREAADADGVAVVADQAAFVVSADCMVVIAPMAGLESVDIKGMMNGAALDNQPVMYCYVSGKGLDESNGGAAAGFYSIIARLPQRRLEMRGPSGDLVGAGDVQVILAPKVTVTGVNIISVEIHWTSIKVCGSATAKVNGNSVTVKGCVSASI
jgi:hypothetical protein